MKILKQIKAGSLYQYVWKLRELTPERTLIIMMQPFVIGIAVPLES
jgi:hypothetical protein